jgi:hypothetical protein
LGGVQSDALQFANNGTELCLFWRDDDQVDMVRHHNIAEESEMEASASLVKSAYYYVSKEMVGQNRQLAMRAESDESCPPVMIVVL